MNTYSEIDADVNNMVEREIYLKNNKKLNDEKLQKITIIKNIYCNFVIFMYNSFLWGDLQLKDD